MANDNTGEITTSPEEAKEAAKRAHANELKEYYKSQPKYALPPKPDDEIEKIAAKFELPEIKIESPKGKTTTKQKEAAHADSFDQLERRVNRLAMRISNEGVSSRKPVREILPFAEKEVLAWSKNLGTITEKIGEEEINPSGLSFGKSLHTSGDLIDPRLFEKRVKIWNPGNSLPIFVAVFNQAIPPGELYQDDISLPEVVIRLNNLGEAAIIRPDERPIRPEDPESAYSSVNMWHSFLDKVVRIYPKPGQE